MPPRVLLTFGALLSLAAAPAPRLLAPDVLEATQVIPAPPSDDSPEGRADLAAVLQAQAGCTEDQLQRVAESARQTPFSFARPVLGEWFRPGNLPRTAAIFDLVELQCEPYITDAKEHWKRPRPSQRDARVRPFIRVPSSPSYPSGHAVHAAIWAIVLSAAFPEHAQDFARQTREAMRCRVVAGVHYPSDTAAGQTLGEALGRAMLESPDLPRALETIRAEAASFRKRPAGG